MSDVNAEVPVDPPIKPVSHMEATPEPVMTAVEVPVEAQEIGPVAISELTPHESLLYRIVSHLDVVGHGITSDLESMIEEGKKLLGK